MCYIAAIHFSQSLPGSCYDAHTAKISRRDLSGSEIHFWEPHPSFRLCLEKAGVVITDFVPKILMDTIVQRNCFYLFLNEPFISTQCGGAWEQDFLFEVKEFPAGCFRLYNYGTLGQFCHGSRGCPV